MIRFLRRFAPAVLLVCVFALPAAAADARGKVKSVTADRRQFVMADDAGKSWTVTVAPDAKVLLNDRPTKLSDLQTDDEVQVTYEKDGERLVATAVRVTRK